MANIKATVSIKDTEAFTDLLDILKALVRQVETNDYKDSNEHDLKTNSAYIDLKEFLHVNQ